MNGSTAPQKNCFPIPASPGFTLIEVVAALSILALLLLGSYFLLEGGLFAWQRGEERVDLQQNMRVAVNKMAREVRAARQTPEMSATINSVLYRVSEGGPNLFLKLKNGDTVLYYLDGDILRRAIKPSGGFSFTGFNEVAYSVMQLRFNFSPDPQHIAASKLVTITATGQGASGQQYTLQSQVRLRLPGG